MNKIINKAVKKMNVVFTAVLVLMVTVGLSGVVYAASTSTFTQVINPGTLSTDIVDGSYASVGSPTMAMTPATFDFACQTITGTFGTATEQLYVSNPDAADNGWTLSIAAANTTDLWDSTGTDFDFNDPGGSGCTDDTDTDSFGGQMTVNPSVATITQGSTAHGTTGISVGSSGSFSEGSNDSITILSSDGSTDIGDWTLQGISISQKIPAEQPAASDYSLDMVLTVSAT